MSNRLTRLKVRNFRSLADVNVTLGPLNVLFGPNGAGKSTLLDAIWFIRECSERGVDEASSARNHGIGARWFGSDDDAPITIRLETAALSYEIMFGYSSGRIEPFVGEILTTIPEQELLVDRVLGSNRATFANAPTEPSVPVSRTLRDHQKLALTHYITGPAPPSVQDFGDFLHATQFYAARDGDVHALKRTGSEISHHFALQRRYQNLWSVLQNLMGRQAIDDRYTTIITFMRETYPAFRDLVLETTGPSRVYGSFQLAPFDEPVPAAGVADGQMQMLALLTALFSADKQSRLVLFDEPEISLHPHALAVFAKAVKLATEQWNKQVLIATHSPVLMSQFDPEHVLAMEVDDAGRTFVQKLTEIPEISDLLKQYSAGTLYMAEVIGKQSRPTNGGSADA